MPHVSHGLLNRLAPTDFTFANKRYKGIYLVVNINYWRYTTPINILRLTQKITDTPACSWSKGKFNFLNNVRSTQIDAQKSRTVISEKIIPDVKWIHSITQIWSRAEGWPFWSLVGNLVGLVMIGRKWRERKHEIKLLTGAMWLDKMSILRSPAITALLSRRASVCSISFNLFVN